MPDDLPKTSVGRFDRRRCWEANFVTALLPRLGAFSLVGLVSTALYAVSAFASVRWLGLRPIYGHAIGLITSATTSYFGHHALTFRAEGRHHVYLPRFIVQCMLTTTLSTVLFVAVRAIRLNYLVAVGTIVIFVPGFNFLVMQLWVFRARPSL